MNHEKPGFNWLTPVLCVNNVVDSLDYYETTLGFDISWKWSASETFDNPEHPTFACVTRGDCSLFLCEQGQGNPGSWICLNVRTIDELNSLFSEYRISKANIVEDPEDKPWGMREMLVQDLDGNTFRMGCQIDEQD